MAKYNIDNIKEDDGFIEFIKNEYGYNSVDDIPPFESEALLYKFRRKENDLSDANNDFDELDDFILSGGYEHDDELKELYYGDKNAKLSPEETAFITALGKTLKEHPEFSLEDVKNHRADKKTISPVKRIKIDENSIDDVNQNTSNVVTDDLENHIEIVEEEQIKNNVERRQEKPMDEYRDRSADSDKNEFLLDTVKLEALKDLKYISEEAYNNGIKSPENAIEELGKLRALSEKETKAYEDAVTDKMLHNSELFMVTPPKMLGQLYDKKQQEVAAILQNDSNADVSTQKADISKLEERIDDLTNQAARGEGLFFADVTNIADTYEGYNIMFDARSKYLGNDQKAQDLKQNMSTVRSQVLEPMIKAYDSEWNIENITEKDAEKLSQRYDELQKDVADIELNDDAYALVSNFKFLDEKGQIEPQFVDEKGQLHDTWQKGYKIAEGSKLESVLNFTKQNYIAQNLTADKRPDKQEIQDGISDILPNTLYSFHVADNTVQGIEEKKDQFTNKQYLDDFVKDLGNIEKPMTISHKGYENAVDATVNDTAGLANRIAQKVGRDKAIAVKVIDGVDKYDKRAKDRTENGKVDKKQIRKEMLKRTIKGGLSAFLVSGAITTVATIAASDASLTAATLGMNKVAGAALGTGLAASMLIRNYRRWRKERKKEGKKAGLLQFVKEPRNMASVATTVMGAAALGFAATGNPGVAAALGYGSLTVGAASGIVTNYQDSKKAGLSTAESISWAVAQTATTITAGFMGREAANGLIDLFNNHHPNNNIFQHKENIGEHIKEDVKTETVTVYKDGVVENAQRILGSWYNENPELLQQRVDAINAYNAEHGTDINPYRYLLAAHDAGALTADNNLLHVQDGPDIHSNANHKVLGAEWSQTTGISQDSVNALADSVSGNDVNITPESIQAFQQIDHHISDINQVGHVASNPHQNDGVLSYNAEMDANGTAVHSEQGSQYTTYANHDGVFQQKVIDTVQDTVVQDYAMVRNETDLGLGMVGITAAPVKTKKTLKERIGSFFDKILHKNKVPTKTPEPVVRDETPIIVPTPPEKPKVQKAPRPKEDPNKKLLLDEYKIVYGVEPKTDGSDQAWNKYCERVEAERKVDAPEQNMTQFLLLRRERLDKAILDSVPSKSTTTESGKPLLKDYYTKQMTDSRDRAGVVMEARQSLMQSNLSKDNFANKITLSHFTKYIPHFIKKDSKVADNSRDITLNPDMKKYYDKPNSDVNIVDLNQYLVEGKPLEQSTIQGKGRDARTNMENLSQNYVRQEKIKGR